MKGGVESVHGMAHRNSAGKEVEQSRNVQAGKGRVLIPDHWNQARDEK